MRSQGAERIWVILAGEDRCRWWLLGMPAVADEQMRTWCSSYVASVASLELRS